MIGLPIDERVKTRAENDALPRSALDRLGELILGEPVAQCEERAQPRIRQGLGRFQVLAPRRCCSSRWSCWSGWPPSSRRPGDRCSPITGCGRRDPDGEARLSRRPPLRPRGRTRRRAARGGGPGRGCSSGCSGCPKTPPPLRLGAVRCRTASWCRNARCAGHHRSARPELQYRRDGRSKLEGHPLSAGLQQACESRRPCPRIGALETVKSVTPGPEARQRALKRPTARGTVTAGDTAPSFLGRRSQWPDS